MIQQNTNRRRSLSHTRNTLFPCVNHFWLCTRSNLLHPRPFPHHWSHHQNRAFFWKLGDDPFRTSLASRACSAQERRNHTRRHGGCKMGIRRRTGIAVRRRRNSVKPTTLTCFFLTTPRSTQVLRAWDTCADPGEQHIRRNAEGATARQGRNTQ